jgi:hypothetical protein
MAIFFPRPSLDHLHTSAPHAINTYGMKYDWWDFIFPSPGWLQCSQCSTSTLPQDDRVLVTACKKGPQAAQVPHFAQLCPDSHVARQEGCHADATFVQDASKRG